MSYIADNKRIMLKKQIFSPVTLNKNDRYLFLFLLLLPVINAFADSTIYYFVEADKVGGLHPGIIRGGILAGFILFFGFRRVTNNSLNRLVLLFLLYLLILCLFTSDVRYSILSGYIKWFIPLMMIPVGIYFFKNFEQILKLEKVYIIGALIVCINLSYAQVIGFGISAYVDESFYTGGAGVGITNQLSLILLTYPLLLRYRFRFKYIWRLIIYSTGFLSLVFVLLAMKRAGIISLLAGTSVYLYLTQSRTRFIRYIMIIGLLFYLVMPLFQSVLEERYNARIKQTKEIENEARYNEFIFVIKEFKEGDLVQKLFGKELFNSGRTFGRKYFHSNRMIHSDLSSFLYGSGLLGLGMYLSVYLILLGYGVNLNRRLRGNPYTRELFPVYFSVLLAAFLISATGSGTIGERSLVFLFLGSVIGFSRYHININKLYLTVNGSIPADSKG